MSDCKDGDDCPQNLEKELHKLRNEVDLKHQQNRVDIHELRNHMQKSALEMTVLNGRIAPLLDGAQPGLITRMSAKLDELLREVTEVRITQGTDSGRRSETDWMRGVVAAVIVGVVVAVIQHFWK